MLKSWLARALDRLTASLEPVPQELNDLDWKSALSGNTQRLAEHLSAFANQSGGGWLVFGIDNGGHLLGVSSQEAEQIVQRLANVGRDALAPPVSLEHAIAQWRGVPLLFVRVREHHAKPVHLRGRSIEDSFIRSGGSTRKAGRQDIARLLLNSRPLRWEDLRASTLLSGEEVLAKLDITTIHRLLERPSPSTQTETLQWLQEEGFIEADADGYYITHFGALAAAYRLIEFPELARKRVRIIRYIGLNKVQTLSEFESPSGYAIGFEELITHLHSLLPHSEVIERALRRTVSVYPDIALRELLANALIHQDFTLTGTGPMVEIFDNRISFTNPGTLLPSKTLDRLIGTNPESRNDKLASAFRRYRICEERGTGFQKVVAAVELFGLPPVHFEQGGNYFRVTLFSPRKFAEMSQSERLEACYQHAVLKYLSSSALTNTSLRERLKMHEKQRPQVSNLIRDAVAAGRIKRKDPESQSSKFAEYVPYWA